jgi:hypothetical protein
VVSSISSSSSGIGSVALGLVSGTGIVEIPPKAIQSFKPAEVGQVKGVNFILGKATVDKAGGGSEEVNVLAIAQGNKGKYILVPPNSTPESVLGLLRNPNSRVT